jgi:AcrR family transcriptional regulator
LTRQQESARAKEMAPPPAPTGVRMAGDERRRQIVRVAMRIFSERGFRGTTTKEIAQAAGVSEAIIFRHFATKDELYKAIIDHKGCAEQSGEWANQPVAELIRFEVGDALARKDDRAVFEGIALAMMRHHHEEPEFLRLLLYSALEGHQLAQMFWERNVRALYEFLGSYIRERQRDGVFGEVDPHVVVRAFSGTLIHHTLSNTLWDKSRSLLSVSDEEAARQFTEILLHGVMNARGHGAAKDAPARTKSTKRAASTSRGGKKKK